ncbi:MAG TPA: hypothetical protein VGQ83_38380 [Polyangia bacterium]
MTFDYSAQDVALDVVAHLERRRAAIAGDEALVRAEVNEALAPVRQAYREAELPAAYLTALEHELLATIPPRYVEAAARYTALEQRDFGLWRGGDVVARITYVFAGLVLGGLVVWAPFIPIWEKWFPFALAIGAFWLPTVQRWWHRRRYARALGEIARAAGGAQRELDRHITTEELLAPAQRGELPPKGET